MTSGMGAETGYTQRLPPAEDGFSPIDKTSPMSYISIVLEI